MSSDPFGTGEEWKMRVLKLSQVRAKTALGRTTIHNKVKAGEFPKPIKLTDGSARNLGWLEHEVDAWIESRVHHSRSA